MTYTLGMSPLLKRLMLPIFACAVVALSLGAEAVWAQNPGTQGTSTGEVSFELAKDIYCGTRGLLEGKLGLLIGLFFVAWGVWLLIKGKGFPAAIVMLIFGSIVTAIPGLVVSGLGGLSSMFQQSGISDSDNFSSMLECSNAANYSGTPNSNQQEDLYEDFDEDYDDNSYSDNIWI